MFILLSSHTLVAAQDLSAKAVQLKHQVCALNEDVALLQIDVTVAIENRGPQSYVLFNNPPREAEWAAFAASKDNLRANTARWVDRGAEFIPEELVTQNINAGDLQRLAVGGSKTTHVTSSILIPRHLPAENSPWGRTMWGTIKSPNLAVHFNKARIREKFCPNIFGLRRSGSVHFRIGARRPATRVSRIS